MTNREQLCREFTELTGGHWHKVKWVNDSDALLGAYYVCECGVKSNFSDSRVLTNPTYENPADVLRVMKKQSEYYKFRDYYLLTKCICGDFKVWVPEELILEPDALLKAAVEWMKERK